LPVCRARSSQQKEAEDYLLNLRDIPRFVDGTALMRTGLSLGICQPKIILNGYQNTYTQHIVDNPEKVFSGIHS
jgi:uncharacterized protein (DUF885 family)